jgi:S1-C subfamily serine protease
MNKLISAALVSIALLSPAAAAEWPVEAINRTIDGTNFIVNRGCSGTLIDHQRKYVLTNYHCIDNQVSQVEREVNNPDGTVTKKKFRKYDDVSLEQNRYDGFTKTGSANFVGEIVAESKTRDLAVVQLKGTIPHTFSVPLATAPVLRGERVYIVGNPLGNDGTIIEGIVSNVNRAFDFPWTDGARLPVIQISGGMAGGNSGGAAYNAKGELIGVPAAGYSSANHLGFAIPLEVVRPFLKDNCVLTEDDDKCRADKKAAAEKKKDKTE